MVVIFSITFYTDENNPNNEKIKKLLEDRYQCKVRYHFCDNIFDVSVWCNTTEGEQKVQKTLTKFFNTIKE